MSKQPVKAAEEKPPKPKRPPGWRNFQKVLKQVVTAPPLKRKVVST